MPTEPDQAEQLVENLLYGLGFKCSPEPECITRGKRPDFFCTGPADVWVEVKSLGQTPSQTQAERVFFWFDNRRTIDHSGARLNAAYSPHITEQDVKEAVSRIKRVLARSDLRDYERLLVTIPNNPDFKTDIEFSIHTDGQKLLIVSAKDNSKCYGAPYLRRKISDHDKVEVREDGNRYECTTRQFGLHKEDVRLGVLVEPWKIHEIALSGWHEIGNAKAGWPDAERFRADANDAAKKIKNALKYKATPSIVFFVSDNDTPQSCMIRMRSLTSILYGVPTLVVSSENPDDDSVIHGKGAFWNKKNTSVSAACYASNGAPQCVIHNPFAKYPFPEDLMNCPEYRGLENGTVVKVR